MAGVGVSDGSVAYGDVVVCGSSKFVDDAE